MKKNKGITLIALILTIVIMLILLAVGASYIINDNLIGRADNTVKAANNKINQQQTIVDDLMGELNKSTAAHDWKVNGDKFTCTCDLCKEHANGDSSNGLTVEIGQEIKYKAVRDTEGAITTTITAAMSGHTENQTISLTAEPTYVVMGVADINENGTNETLLLTITKPEVKVTLKGAAAYNNGPTEINRMCRELYGKDARGMTIEDVNNCLGYTNPKGIYYDKSGKIQTANNLTTKLINLPEEIWNAIKDNHQTPDGRDTEAALGEYLLDGYYSISSTEVTDARKNLILASNTTYWLASRGVSAYANRGYAIFGPGAVRGGIAYSCGGTFRSDGYVGDGEFGLRPVVSITSQIPDVGEILVSSDAGEIGSEGGSGGILDQKPQPMN